MNRIDIVFYIDSDVLRDRRFLFWVDWCYIFPILSLGVYPPSKTIYNVDEYGEFNFYLKGGIYLPFSVFDNLW